MDTAADCIIHPIFGGDGMAIKVRDELQNPHRFTPHLQNAISFFVASNTLSEGLNSHNMSGIALLGAGIFAKEGQCSSHFPPTGGANSR